MDDYISPSTLASMKTEFLPPARALIRVTTATADQKIQEEFKKIDMYLATYHEASHAYTYAKKSDKKVSSMSKEFFTRFLYRIVMFFVDNGSSAKISPSSTLMITFVSAKDNDKDVLHGIAAQAALSAIKAHTQYPRRWCRRYAEVVQDLLKNHLTSHDPALATKWGYTPAHRSLAFDFVDAVPVSRLDSVSIAAISAAKGANTARDRVATVNNVNMSYVYTQGQLMSSQMASRLLPAPDQTGA